MATVGLASCNGDYDDWASPQSYAQEGAAAQYELTFAAGPDANAVLPIASDSVRLVQITGSSTDISGYTVQSVTVNGQEVAATAVGNNIVVSAKDLSKIVEQESGSRAPQARPITVVSSVSINLSNGEAVTYSKTGTTTATVTPAPTPQEDPQGYFLLGDFEGNGWDLATPIWMTKNADGTYSAEVTTSKKNDSNYFKFFEGSHYATDWDEVNKGQMGCLVNGDKSFSGFVVWSGDPVYLNDGETPQSPAIFNTGRYVITLDVKNMTYKITHAETKYYIYFRGLKRMMFYAQGNNIYTYTTQWNGQNDVKFFDVDDEKTFYGHESTDAAANYTDPTGSVMKGANVGFISAPERNAFYRLTLDMNASTYEWTKIEGTPQTYSSVGISGDFGTQTMTHLTNAKHNWYRKMTLASDAKLHFEAGVKVWGAPADKASTPISDKNYYLGIGTSDITVPAGTYEFYLNDIDGTWNIVPSV